MNVLGIFRNGKEDNYLSALKDPFIKNKVTGIRFYSGNLNGALTYMKPYWGAEVECENGNTKGVQKFIAEGADSLPLLLKQVEDFLKHLK